jgi:fumarate reductase flavoprotein subunit
VAAAQARQESRGAHWREDFPQTDAAAPGLRHSAVRLEAGSIALEWRDVAFTRLRPGQSLLDAA